MLFPTQMNVVTVRTASTAKHGAVRTGGQTSAYVVGEEESGQETPGGGEGGGVEYTLFKLVVSQHSTHERRGCRPNRPPPPMHESECALVVRVAEHVQRRRHADSSCCWARLRAASRECSFHTTAPIHTFDKARGCRQAYAVCTRAVMQKSSFACGKSGLQERSCLYEGRQIQLGCVLHPTTGWKGFRATTCRVMAGSRCH